MIFLEFYPLKFWQSERFSFIIITLLLPHPRPHTCVMLAPFFWKAESIPHWDCLCTCVLRRESCLYTCSKKDLSIHKPHGTFTIHFPFKKKGAVWTMHVNTTMCVWMEEVKGREPVLHWIMEGEKGRERQQEGASISERQPFHLFFTSSKTMSLALCTLC